ncbi:hypothetical protein HZ326_18063 [Fusarium oxysporum f. sp. albedinis]|nr:hypothetical protein HZ326_18063 [Fusarium oxysporum f. sp. albedinis]
MILWSHRTFRNHAKTHPQQQTTYYCYKCDRPHALVRGHHHVCLGKQRKLDLKNKEVVNAFYEMQFMVLLQVNCQDSPRFWLGPDGSKMADEEPFGRILRNRIRDEEFVTWLRRLYQGDKYTFERHMLRQLLRVAQRENLVSQRKEDGFIHASCGNIDWYMRLQLKARRGDKRPCLSAISMGIVI